MDDEKRARLAPWLCALVSGILGPACAACAALFMILKSPLLLAFLMILLSVILAVHVWKDRVTEGVRISLPSQIFSFFFPILTSVPVAFLCVAIFLWGVLR